MYIHAYMHACIHTYIHTYRHSLCPVVTCPFLRSSESQLHDRGDGVVDAVGGLGRLGNIKNTKLDLGGLGRLGRLGASKTLMSPKDICLRIIHGRAGLMPIRET